eukprot:COSAG06_NODE_64915_length_258_cov_0.654088_1_plen_35_part_10
MDAAGSQQTFDTTPTVQSHAGAVLHWNVLHEQKVV